MAVCRLVKLPGWQNKHVVTPGFGPYLPGPQPTQLLFSSYVPAWHGKHMSTDGAE